MAATAIISTGRAFTFVNKAVIESQLSAYFLAIHRRQIIYTQNSAVTAKIIAADFEQLAGWCNTQKTC